MRSSGHFGSGRYHNQRDSDCFPISVRQSAHIISRQYPLDLSLPSISAVVSRAAQTDPPNRTSWPQFDFLFHA